MKIRCKFRLSEIRIHHETYRTYIFRAEYDPSIPEDQVFQKMSPTGEFIICVTNPVVFNE